jgi:hypothetical protein
MCCVTIRSYTGPSPYFACINFFFSSTDSLRAGSVCCGCILAEKRKQKHLQNYRPRPLAAGPQCRCVLHTLIAYIYLCIYIAIYAPHICATQCVHHTAIYTWRHTAEKQTHTLCTYECIHISRHARESSWLVLKKHVCAMCVIPAVPGALFLFCSPWAQDNKKMYLLCVIPAIPGAIKH